MQLQMAQARLSGDELQRRKAAEGHVNQLLDKVVHVTRTYTGW